MGGGGVRFDCVAVDETLMAKDSTITIEFTPFRMLKATNRMLNLQQKYKYRLLFGFCCKVTQFAYGKKSSLIPPCVLFGCFCKVTQFAYYGGGDREFAKEHACEHKHVEICSCSCLCASGCTCNTASWIWMSLAKSSFDRRLAITPIAPLALPQINCAVIGPLSSSSPRSHNNLPRWI